MAWVRLGGKCMYIIQSQPFCHTSTKNLLKFVENWRSSDRNKNAVFLRRSVEWLGYHAVKKLWRCIKPFRHDTGTWRTDGQTEFLCQYLASSPCGWRKRPTWREQKEKKSHPSTENYDKWVTLTAAIFDTTWPRRPGSIFSTRSLDGVQSPFTYNR